MPLCLEHDWIMTFHIFWELGEQLTNSYFSEGLKPPTRKCHQTWIAGKFCEVNGGLCSCHLWDAKSLGIFYGIFFRIWWDLMGSFYGILLNNFAIIIKPTGNHCLVGDLRIYCIFKGPCCSVVSNMRGMGFIRAIWLMWNWKMARDIEWTIGQHFIG